MKSSHQRANTDIKPIDVDHRLCLVCGACVGICPTIAMCLENDHLRIFEERCSHCGKCVDVCPVRALQLKAGRK